MKESIVVEYFFKCQNFFYVFVPKHLQQNDDETQPEGFLVSNTTC